MARIPHDDPEAEARFNDNNVANVKLAGDVTVLPFGNAGESLDNAGPSDRAANYATGKEKDVKVLPIGRDTLKNWLERTRQRQGK